VWYQALYALASMQESMHTIGGVARHALLHDGAERRKGRPDIVSNAGGLRFDREAAGRPAHLCPNLLRHTHSRW
jgi:hypothetical protein